MPYESCPKTLITFMWVMDDIICTSRFSTWVRINFWKMLPNSLDASWILSTKKNNLHLVSKGWQYFHFQIYNWGENKLPEKYLQINLMPFESYLWPTITSTWIYTYSTSRFTPGLENNLCPVCNGWHRYHLQI